MAVLPSDFEGQAIRRVYDEATEVWWFSVVDVVQVLTQQADTLTARKYLNQLKSRLDKEGSQLVTDCHQLKMPAAGGQQLENQTGKSIISAENYLPPVAKTLKAAPKS